MEIDPRQEGKMITQRIRSISFVSWTVPWWGTLTLCGKRTILTKVMIHVTFYVRSDCNRPRRRGEKSIWRDSEEGIDHILSVDYRVVLHSKFVTSILRMDIAIIPSVLVHCNHWSVLFLCISILRTHTWSETTLKRRKKWVCRLPVSCEWDDSCRSCLSVTTKWSPLETVWYDESVELRARGSASTLPVIRWAACAFCLTGFSFRATHSSFTELEERTWKEGSRVIPLPMTVVNRNSSPPLDI